jgi:hypothetical protein
MLFYIVQGRQHIGKLLLLTLSLPRIVNYDLFDYIHFPCFCLSPFSLQAFALCLVSFLLFLRMSYQLRLALYHIAITAGLTFFYGVLFFGFPVHGIWYCMGKSLGKFRCFCFSLFPSRYRHQSPQPHAASLKRQATEGKNKKLIDITLYSSMHSCTRSRSEDLEILRNQFKVKAMVLFLVSHG